MERFKFVEYTIVDDARDSISGLDLFRQDLREQYGDEYHAVLKVTITDEVLPRQSKATVA